MFLTAQQAGANPNLHASRGLAGVRGMGGYQNVGGDWSWMFYPPPYDFLAPKNSVPMPAPVILPGGGLAGYRMQGLGCPGNPNCGCGPSACGKGGLGGLEDMVGNLASGNFGDALLGYDLSGSIPNWLVVIGVFWAYTALTNQASGFGSRVKKRYRKSMKAKGH